MVTIMFICGYLSIVTRKVKGKIERLDQTISSADEKQQQYYSNRLLQIKDFNDAFELVKMAVNEKFKMHRAGLSLILQGLPNNLGAYHILGSNMIILNRRILDIVRQSKSNEEYNSYLFMVLAHEYIHSFGIVDEIEVRNMTYDLCKSLLGEDHVASIMARYQPWAVFPELNIYQNNNTNMTNISNNSFEKNFEIVKNFDKATQSYIH
jgi:predicted Zn-dependent protease with MMP-like domain